MSKKDAQAATEETVSQEEVNEVEQNEQQAAVTNEEPEAVKVTPEQEVQILKDKLLRNQAELQNFKKRTQEEATKTITFANQKIILELLPLLDSFEMALDVKSENEEINKFLEGFRMIHKNIFTALEKEGLEPIKALGEKFDHNVHDAVQTEHDEKQEEGIILTELRKGYKLHGRVIRPSMVIVNKLNK